MLTVDLLKQQAHLSALTDEQLASIVTLSKNDEEMVMKSRIGEWADRIEQDFLYASGIEKENGEKYFDYIKRGAAKLKDQLSDNQAKVNSLSKKLESAQNSPDETVSGQLKEWKDKIKDKDSRITNLEQSLTQKEIEKAKEIEGIKMQMLKMESDLGVKAALATVNPAEGLSKQLFEETLQNRLNRFYENYTPEKVKASDGTEYIQYRDSEGNVYTNANNLQKPFSPEEVATNLVADIASQKQVKTGTGKKPGSTVVSGSNLTGSFRTKVEANRAFNDYAKENGVVYGTDEYDKKYSEFKDTNKIDELPLYGSTEAVMS